MRKPSTRVRPVVESIEARTVPSTLIPVLTMNTFDAVVADVQGIMGTLARTHNFTRASQSLTALSTHIPFGRQELAPSWQADLATYNRAVPGSGLAAQNRMIHDLYQDVLHGAQAHEFQVTGPGSRVFMAGVGSPPPTSSVSSVNIVNRTGFSITVTTFLNNGASPRPSITRTIANGATSLFDFGTSQNSPISVNVMQTGNPNKPPPLVNQLLNRPFNGYNGASFTISVFGGVFSIAS